MAIFMTKPNYCPNCGKPLDEEYSAIGIAHTEGNTTGYDCYCSKCEWSGDIWPDDEAGNETEEKKRRYTMTIDQAIRRLSGYIKYRKPELDDNFYEAVQLGIEALRNLRLQRKFPHAGPRPKLPGETKEEEKR